MASSKKRSTSQDVADMAGVSRTTVSFVLNRLEGVSISEATRERVWEAARKLNYLPIASLGIFQFLWVWNDLLVALVFLGGTTPVMTYQISNMVTSLGAGWQLLTAAAFLSILLPMIVFFSLQRYFVRGMLAGAVKG